MRIHPRLAAIAALALAAVATTAAPAGAVPTVRERQWYLAALHTAQAHRISTGTGVIVAVVDSGVDATHPDLAGHVLPGAAFTPLKGGDGRRDLDGHGTAMATLIAGQGRGPNSVLGIAPGARILPVMHDLGDAASDHASFADAIRYAADHGARVINISESILYATAPAPKVLAAIRYAMAKDAVVVAGAGNTNSGSQDVTPPANIPGVVAVGGVGRTGAFASGSAHGKELVLTAPSEQIVTGTIRAKSRSGYEIGDGTSNATALVSGVAALIRAKYPQLNAANVVNRLIRTAHDSGAHGRDDRYGFGVVDAAAALAPNVPAVTAYPLATADPWSQPAAADPKKERSAVLRYLPLIAGGACATTSIVISLIIVLLARRRRRT